MGNVNYRQITAQGSLDPRPYLQVTSDQNDLSLISSRTISQNLFTKRGLVSDSI
jgi:hypothetical protein